MTLNTPRHAWSLEGLTIHDLPENAMSVNGEEVVTVGVDHPAAPDVILLDGLEWQIRKTARERHATTVYLSEPQIIELEARFERAPAPDHLRRAYCYAVFL